MSHIYVQDYKSPGGELILGSFEGRLCLCDWKYRKMREPIDRRLQKTFEAEYKMEQSPVTDLALTQLREYFSGDRQEFDLPLLTAGTAFQKEVWEVLMTVPYGKTAGYRELAQKMGRSKAVRAVAGANGANALAIIIPCHRIIGSSGELVGYAGGLKTKELLLKLEESGLGQLKLFPHQDSSER